MNATCYAILYSDPMHTAIEGEYCIFPSHRCIMDKTFNVYINGLMQEKRNSSVLTMDVSLSCINPLTCNSSVNRTLSSVYTMRDIAARCRGAMDAANGLRNQQAVYTRRDVAGRHNDAPPEMSPAPILSRRSATSPQII